MDTPIESFLTAWTCLVLQQCQGREVIPLGEVQVLVEALLIGCELVFNQEDMHRLRLTAACLLDAVTLHE